jgi:hypothetical protein
VREAKGLSKFWKVVLAVAAVAFSGFGVTLLTSNDARKAAASAWMGAASALAQVGSSIRLFLASSVGLTWGGLFLLVVVSILVLIGALRLLFRTSAPAFFSYTSDSFHGQKFRWRYRNTGNSCEPAGIVFVCRECDCDMVHGRCPSCGYIPMDRVPPEDEVEAMIVHRIQKYEK